MTELVTDFLLFNDLYLENYYIFEIHLIECYNNNIKNHFLVALDSQIIVLYFVFVFYSLVSYF